MAIGYQTAAEEDAIVVKRTGHSNTELIADSVAVARITRIHPQVRQGSSVRGAIDLVLVADQLLSLDPPADFYGYAATMRDAMHVALSLT